MDTPTTDRRVPAQEPMVAFYARLPARLTEELKADAARARRSPSAQLEVLLDDIYGSPAPTAGRAA